MNNLYQNGIVFPDESEVSVIGGNAHNHHVVRLSIIQPNGLISFKDLSPQDCRHLMDVLSRESNPLSNDAQLKSQE